MSALAKTETRAVYAPEELEAERARLGAVGVSVAEEIALDKTAITTARMGAARLLMEFAGLLDKRPAAIAKDLASLSAAELRARIASLQVEIGDRAADVTPKAPLTIEQELGIVD